MAGKLLNIRHYLYCVLLPCSATNTFTRFYACAGYWTLERTKYQFIPPDNVKSNPKEVELFFQCCCYVCKICNEIGFPFKQCLDLWKEHFILVFLASFRNRQIFSHNISINKASPSSYFLTRSATVLPSRIFSVASLTSIMVSCRPQFFSSQLLHLS